MKKAEIKVGEEYAASWYGRRRARSRRDLARVRAIEVGTDGTDFYRHPVRNGVLVEAVTGVTPEYAGTRVVAQAGSRIVLPAASVVASWQVWVRQGEEEDRVRRERLETEKAEFRRANALAARLQALGMRRGKYGLSDADFEVDTTYRTSLSINVTLEAMEALLDLVAAPTGGDRTLMTSARAGER